MHIDGACHCEAIAFEAEVDPETVGICHCTDCQTMSGTAFRVVVRASEQNFWLVRGTPQYYVKTAQSGNPRSMAFCGNCGTQLWGCATPQHMGRISIRTGTVQQRDELPPRRQIWCRSARSWLPSLLQLPATETQDTL